ncbi:class I SAM-dependent methyltransferase [Pontibacter anaerobius]|uniref:Class I SAM-dependent methyltransferase n=1 Tax=Pontibacter anaerobius TaxID=2993940 RepID=A0ABT3RDW6_9BACT|nr:class I SAM-dependent methyltransferase [Pontibacter anaerobius]MCX2739629.1 class I SAM-dependent methyltransferase [Pontibacter anaerobius]
MENLSRKTHWEKVYQTKQLDKMGWYQAVPATSLELISQFKLPKTAKIIDIGGGDSLLVDHLLDLGYQHLTVLDISAASLERAQQRLGQRAGKVTWIEADAATFRLTEKYDLWHDRAAFHFLTDERETENYINTARQSINPGGALVIGTFSEQGPSTCSGLPVQQYSEKSLTDRFGMHFEKITCKHTDHTTPSGNIQNYLFCSFRKV